MAKQLQVLHSKPWPVMAAILITVFLFPFVGKPVGIAIWGFNGSPRPAFHTLPSRTLKTGTNVKTKQDSSSNQNIEAKKSKPKSTFDFLWTLH